MSGISLEQAEVVIDAAKDTPVEIGVLDARSPTREIVFAVAAAHRAL